MFKIFSVITLLFISLIAYNQEKNYPILTEAPNIGIYTSFEELINNKPFMVDGFTIKHKTNIKGDWKDTETYYPEIEKGNKYAEKLNTESIYAFSNGVNFYLLHQSNYFPLIIKNNKINFMGYHNINLIDSANYGGLLGLIFYKNEREQIKNTKVMYYLNPENGDVVMLDKEHEDGKLNINFYRGDQKENKKQKAIFYHNGKKHYLGLNDFISFEFEAFIDDHVEFCFEEENTGCIKRSLIFGEDQFIQLSRKKNSDKQHIKIYSGFSAKVKFEQTQKKRNLINKKLRRPKGSGKNIIANN